MRSAPRAAVEHCIRKWGCIEILFRSITVRGRTSKRQTLHRIRSAGCQWQLSFEGLCTGFLSSGLAALAPRTGGHARDKLHGTNRLLQNYAVSCGFLLKSAVSCESLRLQNAVIPAISSALRISQKISENLRTTK